MKKILAIGIAGLFLLTGVSIVSALEKSIIKTTSDINFAIEEVTYEPKPPIKGELVTFNVTVSFEGWDKIVKVQLYRDGVAVDGSLNYAHPDMPAVEIYYLWPHSDSSYKINITVDPDERYEETIESDNYWEETISAKSKSKTFTNPVILRILEMFPILSRLLKL